MPGSPYSVSTSYLEIVVKAFVRELAKESLDDTVSPFGGGVSGTSVIFNSIIRDRGRRGNIVYLETKSSSV